MELVLAGQLGHLHHMLKDSVPQGLVATCPLKKQFVFWVAISYIPDLFTVISVRQLSQVLRVELATVWKGIEMVLFEQLCAKRVDGNDEGVAVCFKL